VRLQERSLPLMRRRVVRLPIALLIFAWIMSGGIEAAHAQMKGMHMGDYRNNPIAWMQAPGGSVGAAATLSMPGMPGMNDDTGAPAAQTPFHCDAADAGGAALVGITVAGSAGAAAIGSAGATGGVDADVVEAEAAGQSPAAPPGAPIQTPAIDMSRPGADKLVFPNVSDTELRQVTDNIICQCGCGLTVAACELAMPCDVSKQMKYQAAQYLAQGKTPQQTLDQFAQDFGEKVLAAPTKHGLNLIAWILPFVALALGGALVAFALTSWRKQQPVTVDVPPETDPEMLKRIEDDVAEGL